MDIESNVGENWGIESECRQYMNLVEQNYKTKTTLNQYIK